MPNLSYYLEMSSRIRPVKAMPKVWNYLKYRCLSRRVVTSTGRYTPQVGSLFLTMRCNLDCGYCAASKILREGGLNWREYEADLDKVQRIFANPLFANCLLVDLMGGEPLLVQDFDRIVAFLSSRGHITNTSTNGLLLADRVADLKQAGISRVNVSIYDANLALLEKNLEKINRIFRVHTSFVMLRSMVEGCPEKFIEVARMVHAAGCLSLRIFMYRPVGADPQPEEIITDTNPAYLELRRRMEEALPGFCIWPAAVRSGVVEKRCPQLWQRIGCDMLGNMAICCGTDAVLQGPGSNLFDTDPEVLFNHSTLVGMREQLLDKKCEPPAICKACNLLNDPGW